MSYLDFFPEDLLNVISSFLNYNDLIQFFESGIRTHVIDVQELYNIKLDYNILFNINYKDYIYPHIKNYNIKDLYLEFLMAETNTKYKCERLESIYRYIIDGNRNSFPVSNKKLDAIFPNLRKYLSVHCILYDGRYGYIPNMSHEEIINFCNLIL